MDIKWVKLLSISSNPKNTKERKQKMISRNQLQKIINENGIENVMFMVPMKPIRTMSFISYTSSQDDDVIVPCKINEDRYKINERYKITLESIYPQFGKEHFYQGDLVYLIEKDIIKVFVKK
jgi:hypothetical protein